MPPVLMELMRHESIDTTLRYYVGRNVQATADTVWDAYQREMDRPKSENPAARDTLRDTKASAEDDSRGASDANGDFAI
jgi:hypothetical protein